MQTAELTEPDTQEQEVADDVAMAVGDSPPAATVTPKESLRWFEVVEVPEAGFRCFVRLPNDFQHKDIREKAMAAKARRVRALKNPSTDSFEVLEFELEAVAQSEGAVDNLVHELLLERVDRDRYEAIQEVNQEEEWEHVRQDQERFRSMQSMTSDERSEEEWQTLINHLAKYAQAIEDKTTEIQAPRRQALEALGLDGLLEKVRERRIDAEGRRVFNDTYSFWQIYSGALKLPEGFDPDNVTMETMPRERIFATEQELRECDALIATNIQLAFEALEGALSSMTAGNS